MTDIRDKSQALLKKAEKRIEDRETAKMHASMRALSEMLFVLLPFIVFAVILSIRGGLNKFLFMPEWSIASAVMAGQAVVKLGSVLIARRGEQAVGAFTFSLVIVCDIVPVIAILVAVLMMTEVSVGLAVAQGIFFILSGAIFWVASWYEGLARAEGI